jgi:hypothetical protein
MSLTRLLGTAAAAALPVAAAACVFSASELMPDPADGQGGAGGAHKATSAGAGSTGDAGTGGSNSGTSSSSSGAGGTTSSSSGSDGGTTGGCTSSADALILADKMGVNQTAHDCGASCVGKPDYAACSSACMVMSTQMSGTCGECWGDFIVCTTANCALPCGNDPNGPGCKVCSANNCDAAYHACAGV